MLPLPVLLEPFVCLVPPLTNLTLVRLDFRFCLGPFLLGVLMTLMIPKFLSGFKCLRTKSTFKVESCSFDFIICLPFLPCIWMVFSNMLVYVLLPCIATVTIRAFIEIIFNEANPHFVPLSMIATGGIATDGSRVDQRLCS